MLLGILCVAFAHANLRSPFLRSRESSGGMGRSHWRRTLTSQDDPFSYRRLHTSKILPAFTWKGNTQCSNGTDCSEQLHLTPGKSVGEMIFQWASHREEGQAQVAESKYKAVVKYVKAESCLGDKETAFQKCLTTSASGAVDMYNTTQVWDNYENLAVYTNSSETAQKKLALQKKDVTMHAAGITKLWWTRAEAVTYWKSTLKDKEKVPDMYTSPFLYTVHVKDLEPNTKYLYMIDGDDRVHTFNVPPAAGQRSKLDRSGAGAASEQAELTIGMVADVGQTAVSQKSIEILRDMQADVVLHAGDLSYADGMPVRWDSFGRMLEPLGKSTPMLTVPGNHDIDNPSADAIAYFKRYGLPYAYPEVAKAGKPQSAWSKEREKKDGENQYVDGPGQYWSVDVGVAHIIGLNSYDYECKTMPSCSVTNKTTKTCTTWSEIPEGGKNNWDDCKQTRWLKEDLAKVDRDKTPWLIIMMHEPFYNSNAHYLMSKNTAQPNPLAKIDDSEKEGSMYASRWWMKLAYEPLYNDYGVDLVFNGHCHTYERMHSVTDWEPNECGPTYITMGDGGNYEGIEPYWYDLPETGKPPVWSAFREASFGVGSLHIASRDEAQYNWNRHACAIGDPNIKDPGKVNPVKFVGRKGSLDAPVFDDDTKGVGVDYNGASCEVGTTIKKGTGGSQDSTNGDSVRIKSKLSLGCPIRGREKAATTTTTTNDASKGTATDKDTDTQAPGPALGSTPKSNSNKKEATAPPAASEAQMPASSPSNSNTKVLLGVLIPVGFIALVAAFLFDQKNGGTCFGSIQNPNPPKPIPVNYGETEQSLQNSEY